MIITPDIINGLFELVGSLILILNIRELIKDKNVQGVHWMPAVFFAIWGLWNIYFYPHLGQWYSLIGAVIMAIVNTVWVALTYYYMKIYRIPEPLPTAEYKLEPRGEHNDKNFS